MSKQLTNLIALFCRRIPFTASVDASQNILARNSHYRHQQVASVLTFKQHNYTTSSHNEQESSNEDDTNSNTESSQPQYVCHFQGLPYSLKPNELVDQLSRAKISVKGGKSGVHFFINKNMPRAGLQAYVEMATEFDFNEAKSRPQSIKRKLVDVGPADLTQMQEDLKEWAFTMPENEAVLRLDGLPFGWSFNELKDFFSGFNVEIVEENVTPIPGTGIVYVSLPSLDVVERLIEENRPKRYIRHRYVDMRMASSGEAMVTETTVNLKRARKEERGVTESMRDESAVEGNPGLTVYLRGLPFWVDENRINGFFSPMIPESVVLCKNREGRSNGCAYVSFSSPSDYDQALKRNREHIGSRYIEVYPKTDGW